MINHALELAALGFHVFPIVPNGKTPAIKSFPQLATRDTGTIHRWWSKWPEANVGVSTTRFGDGDLLVAIDVDNKDGRGGNESLLGLPDLPPTFTQRTPTGGLHLIFRSPFPLRQTAGFLGSGLDTRTRGGYVVGAGSRVAAGVYTISKSMAPVEAPTWLIERLAPRAKSPPAPNPGAPVDQKQAELRALDYLAGLDPAPAGAANSLAYCAAARLKDFGLECETAVAMMRDNFECAVEPDLEIIEQVTRNAYRYGVEPQGSASPEASFDDDEPQPSSDDASWISRYNDEFAYVVSGGAGHILWETKDHVGKPTIKHLTVEAFHQLRAWDLIYDGDSKPKAKSKLWLCDPRRRTYAGVVFAPGQRVSRRFYNLWQGFKVEPYDDILDGTAREHRALQAFLSHVRDNVCAKDPALFKWVMGYFAHIFQYPGEKPLVTLVMKGAKGVGKNAVLDRLGYLLGDGYFVAQDDRYLLSNFNAHLENNLLFVLDEAAPWAGDKRAEGKLKGITTAPTRPIERKGQESYTARSYTRAVILTNEDWAVPASWDERRYCVLKIGDGRKQQRAFFQEMREAMEAGGYRLLLRYLLDFDLSDVHVNAAPNTEGLYEEKLASLGLVHEWWHECLEAGRIVFCDFGDDQDPWPGEITKSRFREAFTRYCESRKIHRSRIPTDRAIGRQIKSCCSSIDGDQKAKGHYVYRLPLLDVARQEWDSFIGHKRNWKD